MRYLKTYEGIIKASEATYLPISNDIIKIVNTCLNELQIYSKKDFLN
jgi:hypothetical protein